MSQSRKWHQTVQKFGNPRQLPVEREGDFRLSFLPMANRTIQKDGIHFKGFRYFSDKLRELRKGKSGINVESGKPVRKVKPNTRSVTGICLAELR